MIDLIYATSIVANAVCTISLSVLLLGTGSICRYLSLDTIVDAMNGTCRLQPLPKRGLRTFPRSSGCVSCGQSQLICYLKARDAIPGTVHHSRTNLSATPPNTKGHAAWGKCSSVERILRSILFCHKELVSQIPNMNACTVKQRDVFPHAPSRWYFA